MYFVEKNVDTVAITTHVYLWTTLHVINSDGIIEDIGTETEQVHLLTKLLLLKFYIFLYMYCLAAIIF